MKRLVQRVGWDLHRHDPEHTLTAFLSELVPSMGVDCVLDVGAHHGEYGLLLRTIGYDGPIVSFEPVSSSRRVLESVTAPDDRWRILPYALGARDGKARINVTAATDMASILQPNALAVGAFDACTTTTEAVTVRRLDSVFDEVTGGCRHVLLKIDTQGFDLEVFRGSLASRDRISAVQVEVGFQSLYEGQPSYVTMLSEFDAAGFLPAAFFRISRDTHWRLISGDAVLVRKDVVAA